MAQLKPPIHKDLKASDVRSAIFQPKVLIGLAAAVVGLCLVTWFATREAGPDLATLVAEAPTRVKREKVPDPTGRVLAEGFVKGAGDAVYKTSDLFSDYSFTSRAARTYEMTFAPRKDDCRLTPPSQGAKLHYASIGNARLRSAIRAMSLADMRAEISELQLYNANNPTPRNVDDLAKAPGLRRADVLVTDTSGPVALVLEALEEGTVWNVMQAPGVQIERVSFVAPGTSGIAIAPGTQVEGIDLNLTPECSNAVRSLTNGSAASVYADSTLQVLIGPEPTSPVAYTPLDGRSVQILQNDVIFAPLDAEQGAQYFRALYFDLMTQG